MVGSGKIHPGESCTLTAAVVALEAKSEDHGTPQQAAVHGSVRVMASLAPFDDCGRVLIDEGAAPVAVALQASLVIERCLVHHGRTRRHTPSGGECAVRIVAIPAIHEAFVDAVFGRHLELRAHAGVTCEARLAASLGEQKLRAGRMMDGVAIRAGYAVQGVLGPLNVGFLKVLGVAREARIQDLLGLHEGECMPDGRFPATGCHVLLPRTVTTFTAGLLGRPVARRQRLIVWVLIEAGPYIRVASFTCVTAEICVRGRRLRRTKGCYKDEYDDSDTYPLPSEHVNRIHTYKATKLL